MSPYSPESGPDAHICTNMKSKEIVPYKGVPMDYNSVDITELETMLARLQRELEDVEETIDFHFTYTSAHIGGHKVRKDEERLKQLKRDIANIKEVLSTRT